VRHSGTDPTSVHPPTIINPFMIATMNPLAWCFNVTRLGHRAEGSTMGELATMAAPSTNTKRRTVHCSKHAFAPIASFRPKNAVAPSITLPAQRHQSSLSRAGLASESPFTGDDPVNGVDPLGLFCILGTNPGGGCRGASEVKSAVNTVGKAVNTVIQASPVGQAADAVSRWTGLTIGGCVGGSYFGGPAVTANLCYAVTPSGQSGFTFSAGGGGGGPLGINALIGPFVSNAQKLSDLSGGFGYAEGSAGEGPYGAGVTGAIGQNACGRTIWSAEAGWAPGLRLPIPAPFTFGGGGTYTWTFGQLG
jgi:hypothetical protein